MLRRPIRGSEAGHQPYALRAPWRDDEVHASHHAFQGHTTLSGRTAGQIRHRSAAHYNPRRIATLCAAGRSATRDSVTGYVAHQVARQHGAVQRQGA
eukprot:15262368-Alexandrium_andersonii.AAC.1